MINISTDIPRKIQDGLGDSAIAMDDVCSEIKVTNKEEYIASAAILLKTKQMAKLISSEFSVQNHWQIRLTRPSADQKKVS